MMIRRKRARRRNFIAPKVSTWQGDQTCDNRACVFTPGPASNKQGIMTEQQNLFFHKFGITPSDLQRYLGEALSAGGDYADLYFEYLTSTSITVDESIVKSASQGISAGCGIRVLAGDRTGYAYTDDLAPEKIMRAARTAALIARGPAKSPIEGFKEANASHQLYPIAAPSAEADIAAKLELVMRGDRSARAYDPRIVQVRAGYFDEVRQILVVGSDGTFASDVQPLARFSLTCVAKSGEDSAKGQAGGGGRVGVDYFLTERTPELFAH